MVSYSEADYLDVDDDAMPLQLGTTWPTLSASANEAAAAAGLALWQRLTA